MVSGEREKVVGEHSRPHSVHRTERGTEAGALRCHSPTSLQFVRESKGETRMVRSHSPTSLQSGKKEKMKRLWVHFYANEQSLLRNQHVTKLIPTLRTEALRQRPITEEHKPTLT